MAQKPAIGQVISKEEQDRVIAYLIAITPQLQESAAQRVELEGLKDSTADKLTDLASVAPAEPADLPDFDLELAAEAFRSTCSLCHTPDRVDQ